MHPLTWWESKVSNRGYIAAIASYRHHVYCYVAVLLYNSTFSRSKSPLCIKCSRSPGIAIPLELSPAHHNYKFAKLVSRSIAA